MWQVRAPIAGWAAASLLLGLGFTFFSGATEAWLVDALGTTGFRASLESVLGRGQAVAGAAMLTGSVLGGVVAQATNLGVPFLLRALVLGVALLAAFFLMHDLGFRPKTGVSTLTAVRDVARGALDGGLRNRPVRWLMLAAPFSVGAGFYVFYALQPYLLELYGDPGAYSVAGIAAAIVAGGQIMGGLAAARVGRSFPRRTEALATLIGLEVLVLLALGLAGLVGVGSAGFAVALLLVTAWALTSAIAAPIRQAFLNGIIPSEQRATVLSFSSLMGSAGGVVIQPALGRVADVSGYAASFVVAAVVDALALPFILLARRERAASDPTVARAGGTGGVAG
jgi:MFS family permease